MWGLGQGWVSYKEHFLRTSGSNAMSSREVTVLLATSTLLIKAKERHRTWGYDALNSSVCQKMPQDNLDFQKLLLLCGFPLFSVLAPKINAKFYCFCFHPSLFSHFLYEILFCLDEKWSGQLINIEIIVTKWVYSPWGVFKVVFETKESLVTKL